MVHLFGGLAVDGLSNLQAGNPGLPSRWGLPMGAVPGPPPPPHQVPVHEPIPNYLAWSIISTVLATCLCCPLGLVGIVAIVFASKVNSALDRGDIDGARRASATAKTWCWVATALAIIGLLINIWMFTSGGMAEYQQLMEQMQQG